jgi:hypothetical protein
MNKKIKTRNFKEEPIRGIIPRASRRNKQKDQN